MQRRETRLAKRIPAGEGLREVCTAKMERKATHLEGIRGVAAIVVVFSHICCGFFPWRTGLFPNFDAAREWAGNPLFIVINGSAAVSLFFVLSGYLLTRKYFLDENGIGLLRGAIKRWPRLAAPVLLAVLFSYAIFRFDGYHYLAAGAQVPSSWLATFATAFPPGVSRDLSLQSALAQGAVLTFFAGDCWFDTSLWTMQPEFIGSFLVFALAPLAIKIRNWSKATLWLALAILVIASHLLWKYLPPFALGLSLAALLPRHRVPLTGLGGMVALTGLFLLGYPGKSVGYYSTIAIPHGWESYPSVLGATLLIYALERYKLLARVCSGKVADALGKLSFPIYLVHVPVLASAGAWVYLHHGPMAAAIITLGLSILVALPVVFFNEWWVDLLDRITRRLIESVSSLMNGSATQMPGWVAVRPSEVPSSEVNTSPLP